MGKSTLFKMLVGTEQPDAGTITVGETVKIAYVDQSRDELSGDKTVWEEISDGLDVMRIGTYETHSRSYCGRFNFKGSDQQKFVKDLSGGERNRLHLAKLLKQGANVLLLDEPTNDLDVETLRALEEAVLASAPPRWPGLSGTTGGCDAPLKTLRRRMGLAAVRANAQLVLRLRHVGGALPGVQGA